MKAAIVKRWAWVVSLGLVGAIEFLSLVPLGHSLLPSPFMRDWCRPWLIWGLAFLLETLLFAFVGMSLRVRRSQLPAALRYPPLWFAVVIGLSAGITLWESPGSPLRVLPGAFQPELKYLLLPAAVLGLILGHLPLDRKMSGSPTTVQRSAGAAGWADLAIWAAKEAPVDAKMRDLFDRRQLVERISAYLSQPWGRDESVALLGAFGSGKSSVLAWVADALGRAENPAVCTAEVSCWGLESSTAAPVHALSKVIDAMDRRVDCRALRGLPAAYQRLIAAEPTGVLGKLLGELGAGRDWQQQLGELTPVLQAANMRLVLLIEDADRGGGDFDPQHIQRLLWSLRSAPGISCVIALDPVRAGIDVEKVCDYVERVPAVEPDQVRQIIRLLRDNCLSKFPFIDAWLERDKDPLDVREAQGRLEDYARRRYRNSLADAVCDLLPTPRMVKHCVRRVDSAWGALHGELDLEDLIAASALREGASQCFDFLVDHIDGVRDKETEFPKPESPTDSKLFKEWQEVRGRSANPDAVQRIVDFLALEALCQPNARVRPQGIQNSEPADYFRRLRDENIPANEIRDQPVLADIDRHLTSGDGPMLEKLLAGTESERTYVGVWEHLSGRIPDARLKETTEKLLAGIRHRDGARSSGTHPALLAAWRRCHARLGTRAENRPWLESLVAEALPVSLGLSNELYYFWASVKLGIVDPTARQGVREALVRQARSVYADPERLAIALDQNRPWDLRHLVTPVDQEEPASVLTGAKEWAWLGPPLLAVIRREGGRIAPHIAHVVGDLDQRHQFDPEGGVKATESFKLNRERTEAVFGDGTDSVLEYLSSAPDDPWYAAAARDQAREWLAQRRASADARERP